MHTISFFGLQKLNTLNLCLFHPPLNPCNHFSTVLIKTNWYTISCKYQDCYSLTSVAIPSSVTSIGINDNPFWGCSGLTYISVASDNPKYDSRNNCNAIIETESNTLILGCENTIIPNTVTSIGLCAFFKCSSLTSIDIPNSVTAIGSCAFWGCSSLTSIDIPNSVTNIGGSAFFGTAWYDNQPYGLVYAGKVVYGYKGTMPSNIGITLKAGTLGIADGAFSECSSLSSVTIPSSVISIGNNAFTDCSGLTNVTIGKSVNSVTSIGNSAFSGCTGLTSVEIPNSVKSIGDYAFYRCSNLISVTIDNSVTIGNSAFSDCTGLTSVEIPNSVKSIGDYAFYNCI